MEIERVLTTEMLYCEVYWEGRECRERSKT